MGRGRGALRTASRSLRDFFEMTDRSGLTQAEISDRSRVHQNQINSYRLGRNEPTIMRFEEMVEAFGGRVVIEFPDEG